MNPLRSALRRAATCLLAGALAGTGLFATGMPGAQALPGQTARVAGAVSPALIEADATGSLTLHSLLGAPLDQAAYPADGSELALPSSVRPLAGSIYTVTRVEDVDLTTNTGWEQAGRYQDNLDEARRHLGRAVTSRPTGPDGSTVVADLPVGLYLVHEQTTGRGAAADPGLTRVADFLVTVPITDPASGRAWRYDLHVYPKREKLQLTMSILQTSVGSAAADASAGSRTVTYSLDAGIPSGGLRIFGGQCQRGGRIDTGAGLDTHGFTADGMCADGAVYTGTGVGGRYELVDDFTANPVPGTDKTLADFFTMVDGAWTTPVGVTVTGRNPVQLVACTGAQGAGLARARVAAGCDYVLTLTGDRLSVAMTDAGILKLALAKQGDAGSQVTVVFDARVTPAGAALIRDLVADGGKLTLPNSSMLYAGEAATQSSTPILSNLVSLTYGALQLHKTDADTRASLAGAVFTLYATRADAEARRNPVAVTAVTGADGMAVVPGLLAVDSPTVTSGPGVWWVTETTTPTGYVGLTAPVSATLLPDGSTLRADTSGGLPILNHARPGGPGTTDPNHPADPTDPSGPNQHTGGGAWPPGKNGRPGKLAYTGTEIATVVAAGLILIGVGLPLARRRRAEDG